MTDAELIAEGRAKLAAFQKARDVASRPSATKEECYWAACCEFNLDSWHIDNSARLLDLAARAEAAEKDAARLREALGALGVIGGGYCFCSDERDPDKERHQPECRDARAAIDAAKEKPNG